MALPTLATDEVISGKYRIVRKLGFGDAGTVYQVIQMGIEVDRAIKFLDPKLVDVPEEVFAREFAAELKKLSQLTHRNLVKLIDAGEYEKDGKTYPYYVTDLIHPPAGSDTALTLDEWAKTVNKREAFVNIILQLTDGLSYLHIHKCLHCDIKPNNLMLEPIPVQGYEIKIADLGSSKIILPGKPGTDRTHVVGTVDYAPDYVQNVINTDETVTFAQLEDWFPHWDLFCLGSTLARSIWANPVKVDRNFAKMLNDPKENIQAMFGSDYELLKLIVLRLVGERASCFPNATAVAEAFRKFLPEYLVPLNVKEMAVGGAYRTITQPREKVYLSDRAYSLVEHPVFQRLHNLNQLNFVYMLYPGARHTRFLHSLATYEIAKRYIEGLLGDSYFKYLMNREDFETFLVAALLHDIGQYPLAHAIEDLSDAGVKSDFEMCEHFLNYSADGLPMMADLLGKDKWMDVDRLVNLLSRKPLKSEVDFLLRSMLDGALDVDKVSYLLYDSYFTGARYGLGIDLDGFLSSLVAVPPQSNNEHSQLGIKSDGVVAAEGVISARYSMFSRVYWHHFNRAIMAMLKYVTARLFIPGKLSFDDYINDTLMSSDIDAVRYLHQKITGTPSGRNCDLLLGLLDGSRRVHRRLLTFSARGVTGKLYRHLVKQDLEKLENLRREVLAIIQKQCGEDLEDFDVLFDVPKSEKTADNLEDLFVREPEGPSGGKYRKLSTVSGVAKALCDEFDNHTKKCRVLISARLGEKLDMDKTKSEAVRAEVESYLSGIAK
jgi:HD superfamily phosphohydrolase